MTAELTEAEYSARRSAAEFIRWLELRLGGVDEAVFRNRKGLWKRMAEEALPIKNFFKHPGAPGVGWIELMAGSQQGDARVGANGGEAFIEVTVSEEKEDADVRKVLNEEGWYHG